MNKNIKIALGILIGVVAIGAGIIFYQYNAMLNNMTAGHQDYKESAEIPLRDEVIEEKVTEEDVAKKEMNPMLMMILGVDSRGEKQSRSDTLMVAAINPEKEAALLMSIPRDTYAFVKDVGYTKFNHSMFYGGPPLVEDTIEGFLDLHVDRYVTIDFEGFSQLVDELGGVEVDIEKRMKYSDPSDGTKIDLHPGEQTLMGEDALGYARYRLSDIGAADSDMERIERQQEVIRGIIDKGNNFTSIFKVFSLMDILGEHIKTDLSKEEINNLIKIYRDFDSEKLETINLDGKGTRKEVEGLNLWVYYVKDDEKERVKELIETFLEEGKLPVEEESE